MVKTQKTIKLYLRGAHTCAHNILITWLMKFGPPDAIIQWMRSFLRHWRQRVKIGDVMSDWLVMDTSMPQGSYLRLLTFIMLINSLQASCMTHKYIDDMTLSETFAKSATSHMQIYCNEVVQQPEQARMNINGRKTKEMLIGSISKDRHISCFVVRRLIE